MLVAGSERIIAGPDADPAAGVVRWRSTKSAWIGAMTLVGIVGAPLTAGLAEFLIFVSFTALTLCAGHSVGMHRTLIHKSFDCPLWLEYLLVYLGVLVGMAGPFGMMRQHDLRDWAQRQATCHDYLCHRCGIWLDYWWQCHCDLDLDHAPCFVPEERVRNDFVYRWLEQTWMLQQAPLAVALFLLGGWSYVVWGVALRVAVSVTGHWLVGYFAHHGDDESPDLTWKVEGAAVQGKNVRIAGLISMGESWHNNHHAFPGSAKIGLYFGEPDPGWWLISLFRVCGLATNVVTPEFMARRPQLVRLNDRGAGWSICHLRRRIWRRLSIAMMA